MRDSVEELVPPERARRSLLEYFERAAELRIADDPQEAARVLRERHNFAFPGERIYRIERDGRVSIDPLAAPDTTIH